MHKWFSFCAGQFLYHLVDCLGSVCFILLYVHVVLGMLIILFITCVQCCKGAFKS